MIITNMQNLQIKSVAALQKKKYREEEGQFVIEGVRFVEEALQAEADIVQIYYIAKAQEQDRAAVLLQRATNQGIVVQEVNDGVMHKLSNTDTPQGILAVVKMPPQVSTVSQLQGLGLLIDGVQDPGNLGTILRTAHAAGVKQVWLTPGTVDVYNPKTLRSTMGSIFHLHIITIGEEEFLHRAQVSGWQVVVADVTGQHPYYQVDMLQPTVVVVGSEAHGPSALLVERSNQVVTIPMPGQAESLNVGIAAGILLFEAVRQSAMNR